MKDEHRKVCKEQHGENYKQSVPFLALFYLRRDFLPGALHFGVLVIGMSEVCVVQTESCVFRGAASAAPFFIRKEGIL